MYSKDSEPPPYNAATTPAPQFQQPQYQQPQQGVPVQGMTVMQISRANQLMMRCLPMQLGPNPVDLFCPSCQCQITTETRKVFGMCQWMWFIMLMSFLLFMFAWIPFVFDSCKDTVHTCPRCKCYVGFDRSCLCGM